ncbi:MAG: hypothetical protein U1F27_16830 [Turneriella sp.]
MLAGFGNITGGGVYLVESRGTVYERRQLSSRSSIVRMALYADRAGRSKIYRTRGGAQRACISWNSPAATFANAN